MKNGSLFDVSLREGRFYRRSGAVPFPHGGEEWDVIFMQWLLVKNSPFVVCVEMSWLVWSCRAVDSILHSIDSFDSYSIDSFDSFD